MVAQHHIPDLLLILAAGTSHVAVFPTESNISKYKYSEWQKLKTDR